MPSTMYLSDTPTTHIYSHKYLDISLTKYLTQRNRKMETHEGRAVATQTWQSMIGRAP